MKKQEKGQKTLKTELKINFGGIFTFTTLLVIMVVIGLIRVASANNAIETYDSYIEELYAAETAHYKWLFSLSQSLLNDTEFTGTTDHTACDFGQFIYSDAAASNPLFSDFLAVAEPLHKQIHNAAENVLALKASNDTQYLTIYQQEVASNVETLVLELDSFINDLYLESEQVSSQFSITMAQMGVSCLLAMLVISYFSLRFYFMIKREIILNLSLIGAQTKKLSQGNLNLDFSFSTGLSEIEELKNSLDFSCQELSRYIQAIDFAMKEFSKGNLALESPIEFIGDFKKIEESITDFTLRISEVLNEVKLSSDQVAQGADQIACGAQDLSSGAESQANNVDDLTKVLKSVSDQLNETVGNIKDMENMMNDACGLVNDGNGQMKEMIVSMEDISDRSQQIKKIISIINDITSQTTLLALNASIEAARAGEAGRGFAVVADEVTELARKSSDAADEISRLIEDTMEAVSIGSNKAKKTAAMLEDIATQSHDISQRMTEIAQITNEESASLDQIVSSVNDISSVIQSNSATSQESAASSEELSAQAQVLKDLTRGFQLKGFQ